MRKKDDVTAGEELERLLEIMARLRSPDGCPWDREQTIASLRPFVLEEAHELVDAMDRDDTGALMEELGDVLLEVVFVTQVAAEADRFDMADVARGIREKLVRRHPHVFRTKEAENASEALEHWEAMKAREKPGDSSVLDRVPSSLPAITRAGKLSKRAAQAGFDWESVRDVREKVAEELRELDDALESPETARIHEEIGDLLFALVNLARHAGTDAELALIDANRKFERRFRRIEERLGSEGRSVSDVSMDELEELWRRAKTEA